MSIQERDLKRKQIYTKNVKQGVININRIKHNLFGENFNQSRHCFYVLAKFHNYVDSLKQNSIQFEKQDTVLIMTLINYANFSIFNEVFFRAKEHKHSAHC